MRKKETHETADRCDCRELRDGGKAAPLVRPVAGVSHPAKGPHAFRELPSQR